MQNDVILVRDIKSSNVTKMFISSVQLLIISVV